MHEMKKTVGNQSGEKMLQIFEHLVMENRPLRLLDIANDLNISSSTVLRFLTTLMRMDYVEQDQETLKYRPTYKICALASRVSYYTDLREAARPFMDRLVDLFHESACLSIEKNMQATYIEVIRGPEKYVMTMQSVGNTAPMHCTGNGKLLLLNYSEDELDNLIRVRGLKRYTEHTITSKSALLEELDRIRARGYAFDEQEMELGSRCLAFPIYDMKGRVLAGLSVTGTTYNLTDEVILPRLEEFRGIAAEISKKMGYRSLQIHKNMQNQ